MSSKRRKNQTTDATDANAGSKPTDATKSNTASKPTDATKSNAASNPTDATKSNATSNPTGATKENAASKPTDASKYFPAVVATPVKHAHDNFPYNFVPSTEKFFGCCSQRAGCVIIGMAQIVLGSLATGLQVVLALIARGGIDLTKFFGSFPKEEAVKKFIFGVSVVDIFSKVVFIVSGVIIILGAVKRNASLLNAWMCVNSYTFASSIATNAAAVGGLISFADSREEYAVPLTFDTILMGAQFYVMTIVKGYHKHLEKAEEALRDTSVKDGKDGNKATAVDDHDIVHSSIKFKCWKCCSYEEQLQKHKSIDHVKAWKEAENERRSSINAHASEAEQKKLENRALDAERRYQRLLLQQALREEQNRRRQYPRGWQGPTPGQPRPWPPPPPPPTGYRGTNPNLRPGQPSTNLPQPGWVPAPGWPLPQDGWIRPDPNRRPQGPQPVQPQPPGRQSQPFPPAQPQPKPLTPDVKKRVTDPYVRPLPPGQSTSGYQQPQLGPSQPVPPRNGKITETTKPTQDKKSKKASKQQLKRSTASSSKRGTYTIESRDDQDWQSPEPSISNGPRLSEPDRKSQAYPEMNRLVKPARKRGDSK